jgi:hypothetical protein
MTDCRKKGDLSRSIRRHTGTMWRLIQELKFNEGYYGRSRYWPEPRTSLPRLRAPLQTLYVFTSQGLVSTTNIWPIAHCEVALSNLIRRVLSSRQGRVSILGQEELGSNIEQLEGRSEGSNLGMSSTEFDHQDFVTETPKSSRRLCKFGSQTSLQP